MPNSLWPSAADLTRLGPEIVLTLFGIVCMLLEGITPEGRNRSFIGKVAFAGFLAALGATLLAATQPGDSFGGMLRVDEFGTFVRVLVICIALVTSLFSGSFLRREHADTGEYWGLMLFSVVGQSLMATANELIMIFIGLEISSIATYVMAGYLRDDKRANESAAKYFLLGSFATAFLLYGVAWVYGLTGTTNLAEVRLALGNGAVPIDPMLIGMAMGLIFVGLAFKVSAAPFQFWTPDVYQGAPAPVTAFMSAAPKAAAFAVLIRVFLFAFEPLAAQWQNIVWICALLTMMVGNFAALKQRDIKRMLAYSSIAHAGYILVAIAAHSQIGVAAVLFYLASYAAMNVGAFAVVSYVARQGERYTNIEDFAGLATRQPMVAGLFAVFLLSLIGVPLTGGFFGKFYLFQAALESDLVWLTILGLMSSAVGAFYYLRVIMIMYTRDAGESMADLQAPTIGTQAALWTSAIATLVLGIFPSFVLDQAARSAGLFKVMAQLR